MKTTLAVLLLILLCAPGMAQTKGKPAQQEKLIVTFTPAELKDQDAWLKSWSEPTLVMSEATFQISPYPAPVTWMTISDKDASVAWLIPTCTTANLKRAPKLTAWVVGMQ